MKMVIAIGEFDFEVLYCNCSRLSRLGKGLGNKKGSDLMATNKMG